MSPETDILIVGYNQERYTTEIRKAFRHWQVYAVAAPFALEGRRFRKAYYTEGARQHPNWLRVHEDGSSSGTSITLARNALKTPGAEVLPFAQYEEPTSPDPQDWQDAVLVSDLRRSRYAADFH